LRRTSGDHGRAGTGQAHHWRDGRAGASCRSASATSRPTRCARTRALADKTASRHGYLVNQCPPRRSRSGRQAPATAVGRVVRVASRSYHVVLPCPPIAAALLRARRRAHPHRAVVSSGGIEPARRSNGELVALDSRSWRRQPGPRTAGVAKHGDLAHRRSAGDLDSQGVHETDRGECDRVSLSAQSRSDRAGVRTLSPHLDENAELLRLALNEAQFHTATFDRFASRSCRGGAARPTDPTQWRPSVVATALRASLWPAPSAARSNRSPPITAPISRVMSGGWFARDTSRLRSWRHRSRRGGQAGRQGVRRTDAKGPLTASPGRARRAGRMISVDLEFAVSAAHRRTSASRATTRTSCRPSSSTSVRRLVSSAAYRGAARREGLASSVFSA